MPADERWENIVALHYLLDMCAASSATAILAKLLIQSIFVQFMIVRCALTSGL